MKPHIKANVFIWSREDCISRAFVIESLIVLVFSYIQLT